jgi:hypothetical protein
MPTRSAGTAAAGRRRRGGRFPVGGRRNVIRNWADLFDLPAVAQRGPRDLNPRDPGRPRPTAFAAISFAIPFRGARTSSRWCACCMTMTTILPWRCCAGRMPHCPKAASLLVAEPMSGTPGRSRSAMPISDFTWRQWAADGPEQPDEIALLRQAGFRPPKLCRPAPRWSCAGHVGHRLIRIIAPHNRKYLLTYLECHFILTLGARLWSQAPLRGAGQRCRTWTQSQS